ncbi:MAG: DMT family transporter [Chloroherpetonaceae bacterium]|nr:DMT family transporter [Chloroherpetonaceae bacterium]MDW8437439.1 DMT family transporter [Chloroherpetonaceae bacterium]
MSERNKGAAFILLAAILWSTGGAIIKATSLNAFQTSLWRSLFATLALLLVARPKTILLDSATLVASLAYAATLVFFALGTKLTTAANAILLQYAAPIYILPLSHWILGERITRVGAITVALCLLGMTIFFLDKLSPEGYAGNVAALLSGICFALMTVYLRKNKEGDPLSSILLGNVCVVLTCGAMSLLQFASFEAFALSPSDALRTGFLGVFQIAIPYALFVHGIKRVPALEASLLSMLEPILNPMWAALLVGETPSINAMMGGAVIVGAVAFYNVASSRQARLKQKSLD